MANERNELRTIDQEMHGLWSMVKLLADDTDYEPTPPENRQGYGLIADDDEDDNRLRVGAADLARERMRTDGPASPIMIADAKRFTEALEGDWKGDHGLVLCWLCVERRLVLAPRAVRVEAICLNCGGGFFCEAALDARLEAVGVTDFRDYPWKRRARA